jgi:serpin B
MLLINAIYFNGDWTYQFDRGQTTDEAFELQDGSRTTVPMMAHKGAIPVRLYQNPEYDVLDLWYGGQAYSMTIVVPQGANTIDDMTRALTATQWDSWMLSVDSTDALIFVPKLMLEYEIELNDVLSALGMEVAFTPSADFTNMVANGNANISKVRHKTFVELDEKGTTAAAVTSTEMQLTSPPTIRINRPFIFAIRENHSGTILFLGKVVDPR